MLRWLGGRIFATGSRMLMRRQLKWCGTTGEKPQESPLLGQRRKLLQELNIEHLFNASTPEQASTQPTNSLASLTEERLLESLLQRITDQTIELSELAYMLNFLEQEPLIIELLNRILPSIHLLDDSEFLFVWQKVLAYRPPKLPQVPPPRSLANIELVLVVLAELYPAHKLIPWVENVVLWEGTPNNLPLLCMGLFTIRQNLTEEDRNLHEKVLRKAHQFVLMRVLEADYPTFLTVANLALELNNPVAVELLSKRKLLIEETTVEQICWFIINLNTYDQKESKPLVQASNMLLSYIRELYWQEFMKVSIFVGFWRILKQKKELKGHWIKFLEKLISFTTKKYDTFTLDDLTLEEVVEIIECCEHHRISNQQLMYELLVRLQGRLRTLDKDHLVRLVVVLITYIRQFEDFFVQLRRVCDQRRSEFSTQQLQELHRVFQRCRVLFNRPFLK